MHCAAWDVLVLNVLAVNRVLLFARYVLVQGGISATPGDVE